VLYVIIVRSRDFMQIGLNVFQLSSLSVVCRHVVATCHVGRSTLQYLYFAGN